MGEKDKTMRIESVRIIGRGSLGILYGNLLTNALGNQAVRFIADAERIRKYQRNPATVNGKATDFAFVSPQDAEPADLILFVVKEPALSPAIETARPFVGEETLLVSLLNGITSERDLAEAFGEEHVLPVVAQGQDPVTENGALTFQLLGQLLIGTPESAPEKAGQVDALQDLLLRTGFPHTRVDDIERRLWSKWMLNVGVNQVVCAAEGTYGSIQQEGELRDRMKAAMREAKEVALAEGIPLTEEDLEGYVALVDTLDPEGMPSMRADGVAKRKTELESFAGTVLEKAKKHGIDTPVNRALYDEILEMEKNW